MYKYIKWAAESFEQSAPKTCILGAKIATVGVVAAFSGLAVIFLASNSIGSVMAQVGTFVALIGMSIYAVGYFKYLAKGHKEGKAVQNRIENPKQPWE